MKEIQESLEKIEISNQEIDKKILANKNISLQNKFYFANEKNISKKNRNSSKSLKTKNENEFSKLVDLNAKTNNLHLNKSKFIS